MENIGETCDDALRIFIFVVLFAYIYIAVILLTDFNVYMNIHIYMHIHSSKARKGCVTSVLKGGNNCTRSLSIGL